MILTVLLVVSGIAGMLMAVLTIIGVALYDVREIKKEHQFRRHPYSRRYRTHPLLTVIVMLRDDEAANQRCLDSIMNTTHRKIEIIIVDTLLKSKASADIRRYITAGTKRPARVFKSKRDEAQAIVSAYHRHGTGDIVMVIDGNSFLEKNACSKIVRHFNAESNIGTIALNDQAVSAFSTIGLIQTYTNLLARLSKKMSSSLNVMYFTPYLNTVYRKEVFTSSKRVTHPPMRQPDNKQHRLFYAHDAIIYQQATKSLFGLLRQYYILGLGRMRVLIDLRRVFFTRDASFAKFFSWFYLPFVVYVGLTTLFLPILLSYFLYVAIWLHQPLLFILSMVILSAFLLFALWWDDRLGTMKKMTYSLLLPIVYSVFFLLSFAYIAVALGSLPYHRRWRPTGQHPILRM